MARSAKKYGIESMHMEVLEICEPDFLTAAEQDWVDRMRKSVGMRLANSAGPVDNPNRGVPLSKERRLALSAYKRGRPVPALLGDRNPSRRPAARARMRGEANPARRPDVRKRMSAHNGMARAVRDELSGEVWRTMSACANALGVSIAAVHAAATKKNPTVRGRVLTRYHEESA